MTFTVGSILESSSRFTKILECIDKSASTWVAYISPLVIGVLQARAIREPKNDEYVTDKLGLLTLILCRALNALFKVLEAVKNGLLAIQSAPPNPWKLDEWSKWLSTNLEMGLPSQLGINSPDADEGILEAAERALEEFIAKDQRSSGKSGLQDFRVPQASIPSLENKVDQQVFEDMRQMMLIPYLHTEYRLFIALRDDRDPSEVLDKRRKNEPLPNRQIDSVGCLSSYNPNADKLSDRTLLICVAAISRQSSIWAAREQQQHYAKLGEQRPGRNRQISSRFANRKLVMKMPLCT